jgi:hypothetical protein
MIVSIEAEEMGLEHRSSSGKGTGMDTPSKPKSSGGDDEEEDEVIEEGEVTSPPHSLPREDLPSLGDIFSRQAGITIGACQLKGPRTKTGMPTGLTLHPCLALVSPDL